jgi:hypothetical protein
VSREAGQQWPVTNPHCESRVLAPDTLALRPIAHVVLDADAQKADRRTGNTQDLRSADGDIALPTVERLGGEQKRKAIGKHIKRGTRALERNYHVAATRQRTNGRQ